MECVCWELAGMVWTWPPQQMVSERFDKVAVSLG